MCTLVLRVVDAVIGPPLSFDHGPSTNLCSTASAMERPCSSTGSTKSSIISSSLSVRHSIPEERLRLLAASPPENKPSTSLSYSLTQKDIHGQAVIHDTETGLEVRRHPDLWFDDGSVICRAENMLFRVHMSQLARHSLCFQDMFMLPQPECSRLEPSMLVDEGKLSGPRIIPLVYLYDKAEDVENLLTALYDGPWVSVYLNSNELYADAFGQKFRQQRPG